LSTRSHQQALLRAACARRRRRDRTLLENLDLVLIAAQRAF
jgi:hypothetical protein